MDICCTFDLFSFMSFGLDKNVKWPLPREFRLQAKPEWFLGQGLGQALVTAWAGSLPVALCKPPSAGRKGEQDGAVPPSPSPSPHHPNPPNPQALTPETWSYIFKSLPDTDEACPARGNYLPLFAPPPGLTRLRCVTFAHGEHWPWDKMHTNTHMRNASPLSQRQKLALSAPRHCRHAKREPFFLYFLYSNLYELTNAFTETKKKSIF